MHHFGQPDIQADYDWIWWFFFNLVDGMRFICHIMSQDDIIFN